MNEFEFIVDIIKKHQTEKRYTHTLGVSEEAYKLGKIFIPEKADKLKIAGLLHDITKDFSLEKQLSLCDEYRITLDKDNLVPKLLHSKTGCEYAKRLFGSDIVDEEIYNAILFHTTGRENMTLFESLVYLADYIEPGRTFDDCVLLRDYFYELLDGAENLEARKYILINTLIFSFNLTIQNLIDEGKSIDFDTIRARNYYLKLKKESERGTLNE
ncbi:MAG: bis(5'-nucleosyl)-tetraphosphatase (symmetrical) YqeK [Clostridia bacterium]|nr:bis(5'-nucleosyl)-tetraphosphatase (symmetrical) YqeK [Clostridia bacterium]